MTKMNYVKIMRTCTFKITKVLYNEFMASLDLASVLQKEEKLNLKEKLRIVYYLSLPGILAQIGEIVMEYIDAAMVGSLGASKSAAIGLVASSTWLFGGLLQGAASGFGVQVAHAIGANDVKRSKTIAKKALFSCIAVSLIIGIIGVYVSFRLPIWLRAEKSIWHDANMYFLFFALFIPTRMLYRLTISLLQCVGNMKVPSILTVIMCSLDVIFNFFLILPSRNFFGIYMPGANLGVLGAQLGTSFAYFFSSVYLLYYVYFKEERLSLKDNKASWLADKIIIKEAVNIGLPIALEHSALTLAQVVSSGIIAPLGTVAIAANSFAVTAESICYMPGYGLANAATTMVGQAMGAEKKEEAKSFAWLTTIIGMLIMGLMGAIMYFLCPFVFMFLTPDKNVQLLAIKVLRIELFAEPIFALSIVATGALRGAKDTLVPGIINLVSIWGVRITLSLILTKYFGLSGAWMAMAIELSIRGILMFIRMFLFKEFHVTQRD